MNQNIKNHVRRIPLFWIIVILYISVQSAAASDSALTRMRGFIERALSFGECMHPEKVFIHLDNNSYYKGDRIWFQSYVVDGQSNSPTTMSRTLYVELLNPGGKIVDRKVLEIVDGRAAGCLDLHQLPFYSGFYEVRAYTKYMMNFGDDAAFSRVVPVFDSPKDDWSDRRMMSGKAASNRFGSQRPAASVPSEVTMRFFPEGGDLIMGVTQRVAFELTGERGQPLDGMVCVVDDLGNMVAASQVIHEGRGLLRMSTAKGRSYSVIVTFPDGTKRKFSLPDACDGRATLEVDNLTSPDEIVVTIRRCAGQSRGRFGVALTSRGALWSYALTEVDTFATLRFSKREMPSGVSSVILFGADGRTIAERMAFVNNGGYGHVEATVTSSSEADCEKIRLDLKAVDSIGRPVSVPLSVSVVDGKDAVTYDGGILPELLLMSDVRGWIRNPRQYFSGEPEKARELDLLMMVQGWRRYSWEEMCGVRPLEIRYKPEQGIGVNGTVVSFVRGVPKPGVTVSAMLMPSGERDSIRYVLTDQFLTDSCGRFDILCDVVGKHKLVMSVSENGKKKDYRILLDRAFVPAPRRYAPQDMVIEDFIRDAPQPMQPDTVTLAGDVTVEDDVRLPDDGVMLDEVVVKGRRNNREADIYRARSKSIAHYDVDEELSVIADEGKVVGQSLFDMLVEINPNFSRSYSPDGKEEILYKNAKVLFVIDYQPTYAGDSMNYQHLYLESIKSIYVNEESSVKLRYADPLVYSISDIDRFGCAVLIETDPSRPAPPGRGTRRVTVEGYSIPERYRNIDAVYMLDPEESRRTLYWDPFVRTGIDGTCTVEFLNNLPVRDMMISVHGIDDGGQIFSN